jgi:hypothetical protein
MTLRRLASYLGLIGLIVVVYITLRAMGTHANDNESLTGAAWIFQLGVVTAWAGIVGSLLAPHFYRPYSLCHRLASLGLFGLGGIAWFYVVHILAFILIMAGPQLS